MTKPQEPEGGREPPRSAGDRTDYVSVGTLQITVLVARGAVPRTARDHDECAARVRRAFAAADLEGIVRRQLEADDPNIGWRVPVGALAMATDGHAFASEEWTRS